MIETGKEIVNGVPKLINVLSGRLSSIAAGMFSYPRKDDTGSLIFDQDLVEEFAYAILDVLEKKEKRYMLENAYLLTGKKDDKPICLFEFEDWIINLTELGKGVDPISAIYKRSQFENISSLSRTLTGLIIAEYLSEFGEYITEMNFFSRRWIKRLSKEIPMMELFVKYIKGFFEGSNYSSYVLEIKAKKQAGAPELENRSLMVMNFITNIATNLLLVAPEFDDNLDIFFDMKIAVDNYYERQSVYWIELGGYYFVANDKSKNGIEIGLVSEIKYVADYQETYAQYLLDIGIDGVDLSTIVFGDINI